MIFEEELQNVQSLIKMCVQLDRIDKKLQICHNICQIMDGTELPKKVDKEVSDMRKFSKNLLINPEFIKNVNKRWALLEQEPVTYFGDDIPKGDMFDYDPEFEDELNAINFKITEFMGDIMKHIQLSMEF